MSVNRISGGGRILSEAREDEVRFDRDDVIAEIRRVQPDAERILGLRLDEKSDAYLGGFVCAMRQNSTFATAPRADAVAVAERSDEVRLDDEGDAAAALKRRTYLASFPEAEREAAGLAFDRRERARKDPAGRPVKK